MGAIIDRLFRAIVLALAILAAGGVIGFAVAAWAVGMTEAVGFLARVLGMPS